MNKWKITSLYLQMENNWISLSLVANSFTLLKVQDKREGNSTVYLQTFV